VKAVKPPIPASHPKTLSEEAWSILENMKQGLNDSAAKGGNYKNAFCWADLIHFCKNIPFISL
jgi:hypothetical protein